MTIYDAVTGWAAVHTAVLVCPAVACKASACSRPACSYQESQVIDLFGELAGISFAPEGGRLFVAISGAPSAGLRVGSWRGLLALILTCPCAHAADVHYSSTLQFDRHRAGALQCSDLL